jgi:hypothetical protein
LEEVRGSPEPMTTEKKSPVDISPFLKQQNRGLFGKYLKEWRATKSAWRTSQRFQNYVRAESKMINKDAYLYVRPYAAT